MCPTALYLPLSIPAPSPPSASVPSSPSPTSLPPCRSLLKGKGSITVWPLCLWVNPHPRLQPCRWKVRVCVYPVSAAHNPPAACCSLGNNISSERKRSENNDQTNTLTDTATHTHWLFIQIWKWDCTLILSSFFFFFFYISFRSNLVFIIFAWSALFITVGRSQNVRSINHLTLPSAGRSPVWLLKGTERNIIQVTSRVCSNE